MATISAVLGPGWLLQLTDPGWGSPLLGTPCSPCHQGEARALCLGSPLLSAPQLSPQGPQTAFCAPPKETWVFRVHKNPAVLTVK